MIDLLYFLERFQKEEINKMQNNITISSVFIGNDILTFFSSPILF
jgi:hypothetical protein